MIKHTPGPWKILGKYVVDSNNDDVSFKHCNLALIAAAPELLDALETVQALIRGEWDNTALIAYGPLSINSNEDILFIADRAIKKATS